MSSECLSQLQVAEKLEYLQTEGFTNELATKIDCIKMGADSEKLSKYSDYDCPPDDDIIKEDILLKSNTTTTYVGTLIAESPIMSTTTNSVLQVKLGKASNNTCALEIVFDIPTSPSVLIRIRGEYFLSNGQCAFIQGVINGRISSVIPEGGAVFNKKGGACSYLLIDQRTDELYRGSFQNLRIEI